MRPLPNFSQEWKRSLDGSMSGSQLNWPKGTYSRRAFEIISSFSFLNQALGGQGKA